jgi:hypothetical protein
VSTIKTHVKRTIVREYFSLDVTRAVIDSFRVVLDSLVAFLITVAGLFTVKAWREQWKNPDGGRSY